MQNKVYISLEDAVRAIREVPEGNWGNARYVSAVTAVRAADVVVPKKAMMMLNGMCSACGAITLQSHNNYCCNCGARFAEV